MLPCLTKKFSASCHRLHQGLQGWRPGRSQGPEASATAWPINGIQHGDDGFSPSLSLFLLAFLVGGDFKQFFFSIIYGIVRTPLTNIFQHGYCTTKQFYIGDTPYFQNHPKIVMAAIYNIVMVNGF